MKRTKAIQFVEFDNGCYVPLNVGLNADGYYRRIWSKENVREMFHRFVWRAHNGIIPEGYEVNHRCRNRACCNPEHLEVLSRKDHLSMTNRERYKGYITAGKQLLLSGETKNEVCKGLGAKWKTVNIWANQLGWECL